MHLWLVVFSFLTSTPQWTVPEDGLNSSEPMRYRGIEQLLAKFEAEAEPPQSL